MLKHVPLPAVQRALPDFVSVVFWLTLAPARSAVHKSLHQGSLGLAALLLANGGSLDATDSKVWQWACHQDPGRTS
jgi:hypothetical protein